jgi:hypothetical protein
MTTRTPVTTRLQVLAELGWEWQHVAGASVLHLVHRLRRTQMRAECGRLIRGDDVVDVLPGLVEDLPKCQRCEGG